MGETRRADMFLDPADDPRQGGPLLQDERGTLLQYLRHHRLTLEVKCRGLDAEQLARRSVPPSTLSLLGLVRHLAFVEAYWFRRVLAGDPAPLPYLTEEQPDADFDGAVADPAVVAEAWAAWRAAIAYGDRFVAGAPDLDVTGTMRGGGEVSLREVLVHLVEEYARHNGHADLLRECIDGRVGE